MARRRGGAIPTAPSAPSAPSGGNADIGSTGSGTRSGSTSSSSSTSSAGSSGSGSSTSASSSSSSKANSKSGGDPYGYRKKAAERYNRQARNLEAQADALMRALNVEFKGALRQKLQNVNQTLRQQDRDLRHGYWERVESLQGAKEDNDKAASTQTSANMANMIRERSSAVSEAMAQGAGESDMLRTQMMSLRNWNANQNEVNRSQFDTLRSINSSLTDLNVDTRTARINNVVQANADKELLWTNYYNQRSEAFTQLGNTRGQQADYYAMAQEYGGKRSGGKVLKQAEQAFMQAAKESGKAWDSPGVPKRLMRWDGRDDFTVTQNNDRTPLMPTVDLARRDRPEGATLREW